MLRLFVCAAVAATAISVAAPAQAMTANAQLNAAAPATVELARYYHHHAYHRYHRGWNSYAYVPHRHCWTVRTWRGWVRRCSW